MVPAQNYLDMKRHERKRGSVGSLQQGIMTQTLSPISRTDKPLFDASSSLVNRKKGSFRKTVTNFQSIRYQDNGGLNPKSPFARGMPQNVESDSPALQGDLSYQTIQAQSRGLSSFGTIAKPSLELGESERAMSVFHPRKIVRDVDV